MGTDESSNGSNARWIVALVVVVVALAVTWATATLFGLSLAKSFAAFILVLFGVFIAMLLMGIGF